MNLRGSGCELHPGVDKDEWYTCAECINQAMRIGEVMTALEELVHHVRKLPIEWWAPVPALVERLRVADELLKEIDKREEGP